MKEIQGVDKTQWWKARAKEMEFVLSGNPTRSMAMKTLMQDVENDIAHHKTFSENSKIQVILEFFEKYTPSPLLNGLNSKQWMNTNELKFITRDDDIFQRQILHSTVEDFSLLFSRNG